MENIKYLDILCVNPNQSLSLVCWGFKLQLQSGGYSLWLNSTSSPGLVASEDRLLCGHLTTPSIPSTRLEIMV